MSGGNGARGNGPDEPELEDAPGLEDEDLEDGDLLAVLRLIAERAGKVILAYTSTSRTSRCAPRPTPRR